MPGGIFGLEIQVVIYITITFALGGFAKTDEAKKILSTVLWILVFFLILLMLAGFATRK